MSATATEVEELLEFSQRHAKSNPNFVPEQCRRSEERLPLTVEARVQPVTEKLVLLGPPVEVATRDISLTGMGLVFTARPKHEFYTIALTVDNEDVNFLGRVAWHSSMGPFEFVGMDIVKKM